MSILVIPKAPDAPRCPHCQTEETNCMISMEFPCYPVCCGCSRMFRIDYTGEVFTTSHMEQNQWK